MMQTLPYGGHRRSGNGVASPKIGLNGYLLLLLKTFKSWSADYAPSMGAALAYYTMFSIAPLLLIVIGIAGSIFGPAAVRGEILIQLRDLMGDDGAHAVEGLLASVGTPAASTFATAFGLAVLAIGATSVFSELQNALDRIWRVPEQEKPGGLWPLIRTRLLSFGMILGIAFLSMASLLVSAGLAALNRWWGAYFGPWAMLLEATNFIVSFILITALFAMIYKIMPKASVKWRDVWIGSGFTALLFVIGKMLIGLYLGKSGIASGFGAAASLVIMLIWVYYSAQIFLLGAEFTWVFAHEFGSRKGQDRPRRAAALRKMQPRRRHGGKRAPGA